jgi:hypothetical protein
MLLPLVSIVILLSSFCKEVATLQLNPGRRERGMLRMSSLDCVASSWLEREARGEDYCHSKVVSLSSFSAQSK